MTSLRSFHPLDLLSFNLINLDPLTETYDLPYYLTYLSRWPNLFSVLASPSGTLTGYLMSKTEGQPHEWHGHVTALSISPPYRRLHHAQILMQELERLTDVYQGWFVDLFVRTGNEVAIGMYRKLGYSVYRRVVGYYSGPGGPRGDVDEEDAFDMRKSMKRDVKGEHVRENGENFHVDPSSVYF
ncbi:acyl-CoA N-acyltransferase [Ascobolus immersus RN42]|uniref:Acyl-CoA N-acyltransferase n=1 Tax=Ascobolus immersus RN42 TaxID=1160509 RepID=A0A3N4I1Y3_ASCIM|nr:acyl-CoA N-acyltransferase [Ascobolus immersus RN42]